MDWGNCLVEGVATLNCVPVLFTRIVNFALIFAGIVAVFMFIFSGIRFITSGGDPKQVEGARKTLTYAIVGLVLIFLSFTIIAVIGFVTGTTCISEFGFTNCQ